jgi:exopolysaccharide biosynthesis polyprenyl glycosylphosphotransferase
MLERRQLLHRLFMLFDLLVVLTCFGVAAWFVFYFQNSQNTFDEFLSMRVKIINLLLLLLFIGGWHIQFVYFRLYHSRRLAPFSLEINDLLKATIFGTFYLKAIAYFFSMAIVTLPFLVVFWAGTFAILVVSRIILRQILSWVRLNDRNLRYILIVGTNPRAVRFAQSLESKPELGYRLLGFVDKDSYDNPAFVRSGYSIVTNCKTLPNYLRQNVVDEVAICLPVKSFYDQIVSIAELCEKQGVITRYLSSFIDLKQSQKNTEDFLGEPFIAHYTGKMRGGKIIVKRALDIGISAVLLVLLSPLYFVTAVLIKLTSQGPAFFIQERVGLNKRRFNLYKFRTMVPEAETIQSSLENNNEAFGPVFKIKNDPRVTPIGKFLRKTSIDELPQLLNVLIGDMSLVGPRALPIRDFHGFTEDWHRRRFSVRPGITCLWQVNGRSAIPFEQWMELDMQYIDSWSLWLDLRILFKTVPAVFKGTGAI